MYLQTPETALLVAELISFLRAEGFVDRDILFGWVVPFNVVLVRLEESRFFFAGSRHLIGWIGIDKQRGGAGALTGNVAERRRLGVTALL